MDLSRTHSKAILGIAAVATPPELRIALSGELDACCTDLPTALDGLDLVGIAHLVVDLQGLDFVDGAGVDQLLALRDTAVQRGLRASFVNPRPLVRRVFRAAGEESRLVLGTGTRSS
jgi:anti-anti-sigma factor